MGVVKNKRQIDEKNVTIIILSAALVISLFFNTFQFILSLNPTRNDISLSFMPGTAMQTELAAGEELSGWFEVKGADGISEGIFTFESSDNNIAQIKFDKIASDKYVYYKIIAVSPGEAVLKVSCDKAQTEPITLSVTASNANSADSGAVSSVSANVKAESSASENDNESAAGELEVTYVINKKSGKFHFETCKGVATMKEENKLTFVGTRSRVIADGYEPCGTCKP